MRQLSKSKLIAYRQCPKRLWLEIHRPELRDDSGSEAAFAAGHQVGEVARQVFDTNKDGVNLDPFLIGWDSAREQTKIQLRSGDRPIFEALLQIPGAMALADVMRRDHSCADLKWEMIEVKGSASVKDYNRDDIAIQTYIAEKCGVPLSKSGLAHLDTSFVYSGNGDYEGLFHVEDLTEEARSRREEVAEWMAEAQSISALDEAPAIEMGPQCSDPFPCSFCAHCSEGVEPVEDPFHMIPNLHRKRREAWESTGIERLEDIPLDELNDLQTRVREANLTEQAYCDAESARKILAGYESPAYFLDFETVMFSVPIWTGTRPFQNIPFQYSLHRVDERETLHHMEFLVLDGEDPRRALTEQMIQECGTQGPVFVYNATFEKKVISELAEMFPDLQEPLEALKDRIVDLLPIARQCYYHPTQGRSWSLKAVTPAIAPELSYSDLEGVQGGLEAGPAYLEAIGPETSVDRKEELRQQMLAYCKLDTLATVRIWEYFKGDHQ